MMKGKIEKLKLGGGGTIKPAGGPDADRDREREFAPGVWVPGNAIPPTHGMEVEYEPDPASRRGAINVRPVGVSAEEIDRRRREEDRRRAQEQRRREQQRTYERVIPQGELFRNPYNFARPLPDPLRDPAQPELALLGRCPPPPHDRAVGLSGRLTCRLTTRTATFVSDSHAVEKDGTNDAHRTYRFHRVTDEHGQEVPCIPASTLRGVVRSVFEAATNSCWEHVAADRRLSRRVAVRGDEKLTPGRIERTDDGGWVLRVMNAAPVPRYVPDAVDLPPGVVHGAPCRADLSGGWVQRLYAPGDATAAERTVEGWYFETGRNAVGKKTERFFHDGGRTLPLTDAVVEAYVLLIADYRERHQRHRENDAERRKGARSGNQPPEDSGFLRPDATVPQKVDDCVGELVYARVPKGSSTVQALSPVAIPRIMYNRSLRETFPDFDAVKPCSEASHGEGTLHLCPACRTFGWVAQDADRDASARAVRSRVRFGAAQFAPGTLDEKPRTLEILSAPKPTTLRFYLLPKNGDLHPQDREAAIDYDSENTELRGRKFYRRRTSAALDVTKERGGQNRTLRDHLPKDRSAEFEVVFQNLAPVELGALLWALELEPGWAHRLGYGKPLGLGAVSAEVCSAEVFTPDRYTGGDASAVLAPAARAALRNRFRVRMEAVHGAPFAELPCIRDLRDLLGPPEAVPMVMYPRLPDRQDQESFRWFVENRRPDRGHWLDLADRDAGLPRDPANGVRLREVS